MKSALKWNFDKQEYEEAAISDDCCLYTDDMDQVVECPSCGNKLKYGSGYTSIQYRSRCGLGYAVCEKCYEKERNQYSGEGAR